MKKYIEAAFAQEKLKELCNERSVAYGGTYDSFGKAIAEFTDNLPAADVRENIHGSWLSEVRNGETCNELCCSLCNAKVIRETNFCYNCGADMREV